MGTVFLWHLFLIGVRLTRKPATKQDCLELDGILFSKFIQGQYAVPERFTSSGAAFLFHRLPSPCQRLFGFDLVGAVVPMPPPYQVLF